MATSLYDEYASKNKTDPKQTANVEFVLRYLDSIFNVKNAERSESRTKMEVGTSLDFAVGGGEVKVATPDPYIEGTDSQNPIGGGSSTVDMSEVYSLLSNLEATLRQYMNDTKTNTITEVESYIDNSITTTKSIIDASLDSKADVSFVDNEISQLKSELTSEIDHQISSMMQEIELLKQQLTFAPDKNVVTDSDGKLAASEPAYTAKFIPTSDPGEAPDGYAATWTT